MSIGPRPTRTQATIVAPNPQSADYTFLLSDVGCCVESMSDASVSYLIPASADVAFPTGVILEVFQAGTGQVEIIGAEGVTLNSIEGKHKTAALYATVRLRQRATDEWVLSGDLV